MALIRHSFDGLAWVGVGSNLGNSRRVCQRAIAKMAAHPQLQLVACSPFYWTQPVGPCRQPWFINGVAVFWCSWRSHKFLRYLQRLELSFGRDRTLGLIWGPRRLDLDFLLHGNRSIHTACLHLPHPQLHLRRFVLRPLADVSPRLVHPCLAKTIDLLLREVNDEGVVRRLGTLSFIKRNKRR